MTTQVGDYKVKACAVELKVSTKKKTPFMAVSFVINGQIESWSGYLTDNACERTLESLRYMGWQGNDIEAITLDDLPGWVLAAVKEERNEDKTLKLDDNGDPVTRIAFINPLSGMFGAPMDHDARKALSLRMRAAASKVPVVKPTLAVPTEDKPADDGPPPMPGDDERLPGVGPNGEPT